jgi:hypothetical protein
MGEVGIVHELKTRTDERKRNRREIRREARQMVIRRGMTAIEEMTISK